ncbi:hypothetical protein WN55_00533 [Dufourea novaeangliae]|uniref:Uncharacterized protein n=1 Tax=Dufourea novaeangliae TaxID=178035 RepID=A0A154PDK4_DUFNO|nr:hypothetical protein WN55_00533 [Dufourea novaeangliae]
MEDGSGDRRFWSLKNSVRHSSFHLRFQFGRRKSAECAESAGIKLYITFSRQNILHTGYARSQRFRTPPFPPS